MASGDKLFLADKQTLDAVNTKIGEMYDTANTVELANNPDNGNIFKRLYYLVKNVGQTTDAGLSTGSTLFSRVNYIATWLSGLRGTKIDSIGTTTDTGATETAGTVMGKLNTSLTDTQKILQNTNLSTGSGTLVVMYSNTQPVTLNDLTGSIDTSCDTAVIATFLPPKSGLYHLSMNYNLTSDNIAATQVIKLCNDTIAYTSMIHNKAINDMDAWMFRNFRSTSRSYPCQWFNQYGFVYDLDKGSNNIGVDMYCTKGEPYAIALQAYENFAQNITVTNIEIGFYEEQNI